MPCRDYYDDHPEEYFGDQLRSKDKQIKDLQKQVSFAESALCAALKAMESMEKTYNEGIELIPGDHLRWIDFKDAGITRKGLESWHRRHAELDRKHRQEEALRKQAALAAIKDKARKEELKKSALKKLTAEERKILGLKG